jgi:hypothetical protein
VCLDCLAAASVFSEEKAIYEGKKRGVTRRRILAATEEIRLRRWWPQPKR